MSLPAIITGRRRARFAFLVANGIAQAGLAVIAAMLVKRSFDRLINPAEPVDTATWLWLISALLMTLASGAWLRWRGHVDAEQLGQGYVHSVRLRLFRHVTRIGASGARQMSRGALMLRFVGDLTALRNWVSLGLARLTVSGLAAGLAVLMLAFMEPMIAAAVGVAVGGATVVALAIGPRLRVTTREVRRRRGRLAATLNDRLTRIAVVEAFGQESREQVRFEKLSRSLRVSIVRQARTIGLLRALSEATANFASLCALFVGALQVQLDLATPGAVVAAMVVTGLLAPRLQDLGRVYEYWNAFVIARHKQQQLLRIESSGRRVLRRDASFEKGLGDLVLEDVDVASVASGICLHIRPGERIALVGDNGAGKSTLLQVMAGLRGPDAGRVLLDGRDLTSFHWRDVRRTFSMVAPDLPLLRGTLRLNLCYGAAKVDEAALAQVIEHCGLKPLVDRLDAGVATRISENGDALSTGEKARIGIARALLAQPQILLLDEADANLDAAAAAELMQTVREFPGTVVFSTHNAAQLESADRIVNLASSRATVSLAHRDGVSANAPGLALLAGNAS